MSLATALCLLAMLAQGIPNRPIPARLETACYVVQHEIAAQRSGWTEGPWAVRWCHQDEWTAGVWNCAERPLLVRDAGAGDLECLTEPSVADWAGPVSALGELQYLEMDASGGGSAEIALIPVRIADDARRRTLARELYGLLPPELRCAQ